MLHLNNHNRERDANELCFIKEVKELLLICFIITKLLTQCNSVNVKLSDSQPRKIKVSNQKCCRGNFKLIFEYGNEMELIAYINFY